MIRHLFTSLLLATISCFGVGCFAPATKSPVLQEIYPNLELIDDTGQTVPLHSFRGNVTLIQTVGMGCPICQGFAGAAKFGPFGNVMPHAGIPSLESLLNRHAPGALASGKLQIVQIVFFNSRGEPPSANELAAWNAHFQLPQRGIVALGASMGVSQTIGRKLVPGFQLVDENFLLRADSTGSIPRHHLTEQLLPELSKLLTGRREPRNRP